MQTIRDRDSFVGLGGSDMNEEEFLFEIKIFQLRWDFFSAWSKGFFSVAVTGRHEN